MQIPYSRVLNIKYDVDVFIAGGGPAGVAAAVAASENGASVFLAESFGCFGGAATNALVPAFMRFTDGINLVASGIGKRVRDYVADRCPDSMKECCPDSIPVEILKSCYDEMMEKCGAKFAFFTDVIDVIMKNGKISYAILSAKGSIYAVKAKVFIDCTGDGDLACLAGAEFEQGDDGHNVMASTLCGIWSDIDWERVIKPDDRNLNKAFADKIFTNEDRHLPGMWQIRQGIGGSNAGHIYGIDGCDADSLTRGMLEGRKQLLEYRTYYRNYLDGYENTEAVITASMLGIRETRRIIGDYVLNIEDFISRAVFPDEIGRYCYPVDIHSAENTKEGYEKYRSDFQSLRYKEGESYGIPYRSLTVRGIDNLLTAGRCISTDRNMQSSVRVMPCCFITGQASGVAAAIASKTELPCREIKAYELLQRLKAIGAYLPNCSF